MKDPILVIAIIFCSAIFTSAQTKPCKSLRKENRSKTLAFEKLDIASTKWTNDGFEINDYEDSVIVKKQ